MRCNAIFLHLVLKTNSGDGVFYAIIRGEEIKFLQTRSSAARSKEMLSQTVGGSEERPMPRCCCHNVGREGRRGLIQSRKGRKEGRRGHTLLSAINDHFKKIVL